MSTLHDLFVIDRTRVLDALHAATGANRKYLYQIATGRRRPSPELAQRLVAADPRLTIEELLFPGNPAESRSCTTSAAA